MKPPLQELVPPLSAEEPGVAPEAVPLAEPSAWHDSSMELERGLDVVELSVDLQVCDVPAPKLPSLLSIPKRR